MAKAAIASLLVLVLLFQGFQGRQHARLQARLDDIAPLRDQLQQKLDAAQDLTEQLAGRVRGTNATTSQAPLSDIEVAASANTLKISIEQFDSDFGRRKLSWADSLELRLCKATLANTEQRFADALATLTDEDEKLQGRATESGRLVRVFQMRGDSFYGLRKWQEALERYRQVLTLKSNRLVTLAHLADCQYALGRTNEALTAYDDLAKRYNDQGDALLVQGKPDGALEHYEKAIQIQSWLIEQQGRSELANELAKSHDNRGNAFLIQGKPGAAITHYQKAIEIQTRLIEQGRRELTSDLAISRANLGNALVGQQKFDDVLGHYQKAIEIQAPLSEQEGQGEMAIELAMLYNNRGAIRRAQGKLDAALPDFDKAIETLTQVIDKQERSQTAQTNRSAALRVQVKVDVVIEYSEEDLEIQTRPRLTEQAGRKELGIVLAIMFQNRGYAHLAQGKPAEALGDFKKGMEIFARLVEQEGQADLALRFAMSLSPLAWVYATNPDKTFRDGNKAREYALKACQLSEWKAFVPLQTLAAACAEAGNFADAVECQEKALELAPREDKPKARSRLELYKSGNAYRSPAPKSGS